MRNLTRRFGAAALCTLVGCDRTAPPRPQIVLSVDTDAPTLDQANADDAVSFDAVVDTVRVDVLDANDRATAIRELPATSRLDWPLSFGIVPPASGGNVVRLRIRAFRAADASRSVENGATTLDPPTELTIDRVVELPVPVGSTVDRRRVVLAADCTGRPPSFRDRTTCVAGDRTNASFADGLGAEAAPSRVGTWALARATPCTSNGDADRACVPGGLSTLGSRATDGAADGLTILPALPIRLAVVAPFLMDRREFTVGRARPLLSRLTTAPPARRNDPALEFSEYCTLSDDPASDSLPLNCVAQTTAQELCALSGGDLPTEAEWNHAATGRGQRRRYPWGPDYAGCCNASVSRVAKFFPSAAECTGDGPEPSGSHPVSAACGGVGDVSRDGVLDLGGSVSEHLADAARPLDDPCWGDRFAVLRSPRCTAASVGPTAARGGNWSSGADTLLAALRRSESRSPSVGFRCVYREGR